MILAAPHVWIPQFCKETLDLESAKTTRPTDGRVRLDDETIRRLKQATIWAKTDVFWMPASETSQAGRLNWKSPGTFTLTEVSGPTHTVDRGYAGNGSSSYLDTGFNPSTNGVQYTQNSASLFAWNRTDRANAGTQILGGDDTTTRSNIVPKWPDGNLYAEVNHAGADFIVATSANSSGLWHVNRSGASAGQVYRNGSSFATDTNSTGSRPNVSMYLLGRNNNGTPDRLTTDQVACAGFCASFSGGEATTFYNILNAHLRAIGAA